MNSRIAACGIAALMAGSSPICTWAADVTAEPTVPAALRNGTIGYVWTHRQWAAYQTPGGKEECPKGFNDGPREQFKQLFPPDGTKRTVLSTQLMRERQVWFPSTTPDSLAFKDVTGRISYGLNLDGKIKPTDFVGPDGEKGVDNQLYRAVGCISHFRGSFDEEVHAYIYNRMLIEISGAQNLTNDDDVTVKSYRGMDPLMSDGTGAAFIPGGTQHVDERWARFAQSTWKGKVVDGVLTTEPVDLTFPEGYSFGATGMQILRGARFRLKLTPQGAEGLLAGYVDIEEFMRQLNQANSTHLASYGQLSTPSLYRALRRLADGYPDPKTGEMTAISSALEVKFIQVFVVRGPQPMAKPGRTVNASAVR